MGDAWKRAQMSARDLDRKHNNNETKKIKYTCTIYMPSISHDKRVQKVAIDDLKREFNDE